MTCFIRLMGFQILRFNRHRDSITYLIPGMVMDVSAMLVARITFRHLQSLRNHRKLFKRDLKTPQKQTISKRNTLLQYHSMQIHLSLFVCHVFRRGPRRTWLKHKLLVTPTLHARLMANRTKRFIDFIDLDHTPAGQRATMRRSVSPRDSAPQKTKHCWPSS